MKKELQHFFHSPVAFVILVGYLTLAAWFFTTDFLRQQQVTMRYFFDTSNYLLLFFIPSFTMRSLAEEKKQGTNELLLTYPIEEWQLIAGKFLGLLAFLGIVLLGTLPFPITLEIVGDLDWGPVIGGYLGLFLMGSVLLSLGLWASSLTSNQIIAFIVALSFGFILYMIGQYAYAFPGFLEEFAQYLGFSTHFANISKGIIDLRDILYYLSWTAFSLFLTWEVLVNRT